MYIVKDDHLILSVIIKTNSKQNVIINIFDNKLKIAIHAKPVQGKANKILIKFLAQTLNISQNAVEIIRGETSNIKSIKLPLNVQVELDKIISK